MDRGPIANVRDHYVVLVGPSTVSNTNRNRENHEREQVREEGEGNVLITSLFTSEARTDDMGKVTKWERKYKNKEVGNRNRES